MTCVAHAPDGRVCSGGGDAKICVWDRSAVKCTDLVEHKYDDFSLFFVFCGRFEIMTRSVISLVICVDRIVVGGDTFYAIFSSFFFGYSVSLISTLNGSVFKRVDFKDRDGFLGAGGILFV